jgi:chemotaxis signal transduction protein
MAQTPGIVSPVLPTLADTPPPALRACLFSLAGSRFAVDVRSAREVAVFDDIAAVPRAPRHVVGVANLRGTVLPIVEMRAVLGLPEPRPARSVRTLVLRDDSLLAAVVVDAVLGLEPFDDVVPPDAPEAAPAQGPRRLVAGWLTWAGETVALLDVPRLLAALRSPIRAANSAQGEPA